MRDIRPLQFDPRDLALVLGAASLLSALAAQVLEHGFGVPACHLCYLERIAFYASAPAGLAAFVLMRRIPLAGRVLLGLIALAFAINSGLGAFHAGVEWKWWLGPAECTGLGSIASSPQNLLKSLSELGAVVRCDEAPIRILGLSLAGYNALLSLGLMCLAALGAAGYGLTVRLWPPRAQLMGAERGASV